MTPAPVGKFTPVGTVALGGAGVVNGGENTTIGFGDIRFAAGAPPTLPPKQLDPPQENTKMLARSRGAMDRVC